MSKFHALDRVAYYRWSASKGSALPGNDPQTGRKRSDFFERCKLDESKAAYKAMARVALDQASKLPAVKLP